MAVAFKGKVLGSDEVRKRLQRFSADIGRAVEDGLGLSGAVVQAKAQDNLSGPILGVKTGTLRSSVLSIVDRRGIESSVKVGTPLGYGASHEFGANISNGFGKGISFSLPPLRWLFISLEQSRANVLEVMRKVVNAVTRRAST